MGFILVVIRSFLPAYKAILRGNKSIVAGRYCDPGFVTVDCDNVTVSSFMTNLNVTQLALQQLIKVQIYI